MTMPVRGICLAALATLMTGVSTAALAQAASADEPTTIEEVIITARKKAESLQDTPISVTAFTAQAIERAGIQDFGDVAQRTPGMQFGDFGDLKLSPTSLRGIVGGSGSAGADPAVGIYVDEIFLGQGAGASLDLFDIERVEVLRGPQGTLFGRNTIGGVVNVTTKRPTDTFEASAVLDAGNYSYLRGAASVSGPIIPDLLSGKLAFIAEDRGGTYTNPWLHRDVDTVHNWSTRAQLLFKFSPDTDLLLTADYKDVDQETLVFETLKYNESATLPFILDSAGLPRNTNPFDYKVYTTEPTRETLTQSGIAATFRTKIGGVNITNVASYRKHDYYSRTDTDRSPVDFLYDGDPEKVWRFSEELRANFTTGPVQWLVGGYYFKQNTKNLSFVEIGADLADLFGDPSIAGLQTGSNADLDTSSAALFGSATWEVNDRLEITLGGRYTRDKKSITYSQFDPLGLLGGTTAEPIVASDTWSEFTPNANARFHFTKDVMGYVTVSKGFKSGGFNDALGDADGIAFGPEMLWNYEAGLKAELFDRRLVANVAIYRMNWKDIQISSDDPRTTVYDPIISNAGAAHSQGIEVELFAKPSANLTLGANLSLQEAEYDEGELPSPTPPGPKLKRIPFAPDYTFNLNGEYRIPTRVGDFRLFGEYIGRGTSYLTQDNQEDGKVKPYGLLNARISWESPNGRYTLTAWGKNLTEEVYMVRLFDLFNQDLVGQKSIILGEPRTYGVTLKLKY
jgi:iron complex outermembrane receptor protein